MTDRQGVDQRAAREARSWKIVTTTGVVGVLLFLTGYLPLAILGFCLLLVAVLGIVIIPLANMRRRIEAKMDRIKRGSEPDVPIWGGSNMGAVLFQDRIDLFLARYPEASGQFDLREIKRHPLKSKRGELAYVHSYYKTLRTLPLWMSFLGWTRSDDDILPARIVSRLVKDGVVFYLNRTDGHPDGVVVVDEVAPGWRSKSLVYDVREVVDRDGDLSKLEPIDQDPPDHMFKGTARV